MEIFFANSSISLVISYHSGPSFDLKDFNSMFSQLSVFVLFCVAISMPPFEVMIPKVGG